MTKYRSDICVKVLHGGLGCTSYYLYLNKNRNTHV